MIRPFWYIRQIRDESIVGTLDLLRQYTAERGLPSPDADDILIDRATQATVPLDQRVAGKHLIAHLPLVGHRGHKPALLFTNLSQLFGSIREAQQTLQEWLNAGVQIHLVSQGRYAFELSTDAGQFFLSALEGALEVQEAVRRDKNLTAVKLLRMSNRNLGTPPYGLRVATDGMHLEAHPDEQHVIELILAAVREQMGTQGIADRLNELKVPCRGERWHRSTVRRVLARTRSKSPT